MMHYSDVERTDAEKVSRAALAISQNELSKAACLLQEVIKNAPAEYVYSFEQGSQLFIKFWDRDEFAHYIANISDKQERNKVVWLKSAYPRAYFYLAYIDVHEGKNESALEYLETCRKLEPDQPLYYCEMALVYSAKGQHERAISLYDKALKIRPHITTTVTARALRGIGVELIELRQLDFAEKYIKESLQYEPHNQVALGELQYIYQLRSEGITGAIEPVQLFTTDSQNVCGYCGKELAPQSDDILGVLKIEGRVLYICEHCKKRPHINEKVLLIVINAQFKAFIKQGQYSEALESAERALMIAEQTFETNHRLLALALNNLALAYNNLGRYLEAEPLYSRAAAIYEVALGSEHPDVAVPLSNLAELYSLQGKYAEAEPLMKQALAIKVKALGPDHYSVGNSLNGLAVFHHTQGRYTKAEPLFWRAMEIYLSTYGPAHPTFAKIANNLACLYSSQERYEKAEPLLKMSLGIKEVILGPDHPDVANSLNSLAVLYQYQGRYIEAEPLYERILNIYTDTLGQDHPLFANCLCNLAGLFTSQGKYDDAESLFKRALKISENALGPDHPAVQATLDNLVKLYQKQERYAEADTYNNQLIAISNKH